MSTIARTTLARTTLARTSIARTSIARTSIDVAIRASDAAARAAATATGGLTDLVQIGAHRGAHRVAIRAGVSMAIPLLVLWSIGRLDLSLYATFGAFTALYGREYTHVPRVRMQLTAGIMLIAAVVTGTAIGMSPDREWLVVPVVAVAAGLVAFLSDALSWHPPGPLFAVFAIAACASVPADLSRIPLAALVAAASVSCSLLVSAAGLARRQARSLAPTPWSASFRDAASLPGEARKIAQYVVAVVVAGAIPTATGLGHPYWAMVAAVVALSAADTAGRVIRASQRVLGTLVGVAIAAAIFSLELSPVATIGVVVALQVGAELFVGRNYGITVAFVTPLALAMVELVHPMPAGTLIGDRALETVLGAVVGLAVAGVFHLLGARLQNTAAATCRAHTTGTAGSRPHSAHEPS